MKDLKCMLRVKIMHSMQENGHRKKQLFILEHDESQFFICETIRTEPELQFKTTDLLELVETT